MMRALITGCVLTLAACGPPHPDSTHNRHPDTRQQPSNYTPGIHVSGDARVGVIRSF
ncbi:hypothetical protein Z946_2526 [Sulfitobacter noctilucicola]|uniref:Putative lipoprotein YmbA n=1 Tax=Sulfitobacter noctilucicola TaxID=1342301 RepID=A0A7W6M9W5_9RHOB|nr:hypothetical protein Z946_2526 [Sulfitobacter noctilucicola]MBB4174837.1 putative lipoprotein YmbA [Sulfitobacter noctilucicola]